MTGDLRFALRTLAKSPAFAAAAVLTLALGIGATSAIFSVVSAVLLRPLPYAAPERLVQIWATAPDQPANNHSAGDFLNLARDATVFDIVAGYRDDFLELGGTQPERIRGAVVTSGFFDVFGVPAELGRTLRSRERSGERIAVVSDGFWRDRLGASASVLGSTLSVGGETLTVVGVMPRGFAFPPRAQIWALSREPVPPSPLAVSGDPLANRELQYFDAVGRLKPGLSVASAQAGLAPLGRELERRYPETNRGRGWRLVPLREQLVGDVRRALWTMLGAVGLLLLLACTSVAGLLFARAGSRHREMAIRSALGAGPGRLVRLLLTESLVLALAGGALGLALAAWGADLFARFAPEGIARLEEIRLDGNVTLFTLAAAVISVTLFGLSPALALSGTAPRAALAGGGRSTGPASRRAVRRALVVGQIALAVVLLAGAGLLLHSLLRLDRVPTGFDAPEAITVELLLPSTRYPDASRQRRFYAELLERTRRAGSVGRAAVVFPTPLVPSGATANVLPEGANPSAGDGPLAEVASASPDLFAALGVPLIAGRDFDERDGPEAPRVTVVSASLARRLWPGADPLGRRLHFGSGSGVLSTVVGVVGDVRRRLDAPPPIAAYLPGSQFTLPIAALVVRGRPGAGDPMPAVRAALRSLDAEMPLGRVRTLSRLRQEAAAQPRLRAGLLGAFAAAALLLAALGVYGLVSETARQRRREVGVRLALGARPSDVRRLFLREGVVLSAVGSAIGLAVAFGATRLLTSLLFETGAADPATFVGVALLLTTVSLAASDLPARRAAKVDPMIALRSE
jgi:predicted permease